MQILAIKTEAIKVFNVETGRYPYGWATAIAEQYGIHRTYVYDIINGKKKTTKKKPKKKSTKKTTEKKEEGKWEELFNKNKYVSVDTYNELKDKLFQEKMKNNLLKKQTNSVIPKHWLMILDDNIKQYPLVRKSGKSKGQKRGKNKNFIIKLCLEDLNLTEEDFVNKVKAF